tara:strand:- start:103 stop:408 length:306 start_codon:yes stop_codon:yes gene_type:complete
MSEHDREILASALTILVHNVRGLKPTINEYLFTIESDPAHVLPLGVPVGDNPLVGSSVEHILEVCIGTIAECLDLAPTFADKELPLCYIPKEWLEDEAIAH